MCLAQARPKRRRMSPHDQPRRLRKHPVDKPQAFIYARPKMKYSMPFVYALLISLLPVAAQAACNYYPNNPRNLATFPATINVPSTLPVGAMIARATFSGPYPSGISSCTSPTMQQTTGRYTSADAITLPGGIGVYRTNVPGVGLRVYATLKFGVPHTLPLHSSSAALPHTSYDHTVVTLEAQFYKTANVSNGTVPSGNLMVNNWDGRPIHTVVLSNPVSFVAPVATCDLATSDLNRTITLDPVRITNFTGVSAGLKYFDLTATCSNASNVTFRFTGTPATGNPALFANTGTAGGVGLWLHTPNQTVSHNSTRNVAVSGNRAVLRLGAEYHKTSGALTKGTLVSTVTVNISYN
ncbi:Pilin (type 1 fimbria component protein) [Pseudomonas asplenii]|uniref:Pilin (Type 1 fimbria component protein) n=2 Tax=Pseudomonas asplenii TaxID=53407 RepID=A0A1H6LLN4_9PSED|nr:Pilin (type 1 fimbria component protein) [Pseudomonas fuscovaginae]